MCMAGDHIFGLVPLMASCLDGAGGMVDDSQDMRLRGPEQNQVSPSFLLPRLCRLTSSVQCLEIYGPLGTRAFVRTAIHYSYSNLGAPYVVHELRLPDDPQDGDVTTLPARWPEQPGRNIAQTDGIWKDIFCDEIVTVSAAPIYHSVPSVGFVITELPIPGKMDPAEYLPHLKRTNTPLSVMKQLQQGLSVELSDGTLLFGPSRRPGRKLVILGDTYDPSPIAALAAEADLLVHEATNAHLPGIDSSTKPEETYESVEARTKARGHSTPQMAGRFAKRICAKKLLLNHFSARYAGNDDVDEGAKRIMKGIRELAVQEYDGPVICARDFMSFDVELAQT